MEKEGNAVWPTNAHYISADVGTSTRLRKDSRGTVFWGRERDGTSCLNIYMLNSCNSVQLTAFRKKMQLNVCVTLEMRLF